MQTCHYGRHNHCPIHVQSVQMKRLGAICARLNVVTKPMQIYNMDETGVSIVHKPGRVIAELGRSKRMGSNIS